MIKTNFLVKTKISFPPKLYNVQNLPSWQGALQGWPQLSLGSLHGCVQFESSHSPAWQILEDKKSICGICMYIFFKNKISSNENPFTYYKDAFHKTMPCRKDVHMKCHQCDKPHFFWVHVCHDNIFPSKLYKVGSFRHCDNDALLCDYKDVPWKCKQTNQYYLFI